MNTIWIYLKVSCTCVDVLGTENARQTLGAEVDLTNQKLADTARSIPKAADSEALKSNAPIVGKTRNA